MLRNLLLAAIIICIVGLVWRLVQLMSRKEPRIYSRARGSAARGVVYAYTLGLAPWSKESTRRHPFSFVRGIVFHLGILVSFILLILSMMGPQRLPDGSWRSLLGGLAVAGAVCGWLGLVERLTSAELRRLSIPEDYWAVALVTLFITLAGVYAWVPNTVGLFWIVSILVLIYIPCGKIAHLLYWFYIRYRFGWRYGHRGVIPKTLAVGEVKKYGC